jgi:transposase-like protein
MANSILSAKVLQSEAAAIAWVEARVWPEGPVCPHCGGVERIGKMKGKATRIGLYKCYQCRKQFTVKVGTVFEDSHVPMNLWLQAMYLLCSSKKGISSNQLSRTLGVTLKTAWFMSHRIREAMRVVGVEPMGGAGATVEVDETFIGRVDGQPKRKRGWGHKNTVLTLVQRNGEARSFHVDGVRVADLAPIIRANISRETQLMTDEGTYYREVGRVLPSRAAPRFPAVVGEHHNRPPSTASLPSWVCEVQHRRSKKTVSFTHSGCWSSFAISARAFGAHRRSFISASISCWRS